MSAAGLESWAELGLIVSMVTFIGVVVYVLWGRRAAVWDRARFLPLEEDAAPEAERRTGALGAGGDR